MASTSVSPARSRGPVHISLPASVAYNANALKKTITSLMERIGCPTCFSGADCRFSLERNLSVDPQGALTANPPPVPWHSAETTPVPRVAVGFQGRVAYNIQQVYQAIDNVNGRLGCLACHSGFDVDYLSEVILLGVDSGTQVQQYGGTLSA